MSFDPNTSTPNEYADCYRDVLGPNVIPSNGKVPNIGKWQPFQDKPIPPELHKHWKYVDDFRNGIQAIAGRVWHNPERTHLYFWAIDIDNELGIKEILAGFEVASLESTNTKT